MKLDSLNHIEPTKKNLIAILSYYDLDLTDFKPAAKGIENTTLIVTCRQGKFVVRVYRRFRKSNDVINEEIRFTDYLRVQGIKTPRIIVNINGEPLTTAVINKVMWQIIVMEYVDGVHAPTYTSKLISGLATIQADMHLASSGFSNRHLNNTGYELWEQPFIRQIDLTSLHDNRLTDFLKRGQEYQVVLNKTLPLGLCHLDYDKDNVLATADDSITAVLDFDDMAPAPFAVDLAYTLRDIHYYGTERLAKQYLRYYERHRPLRPLEKSCLQSIMLFRHYFIRSISILMHYPDSVSIEKSITIEATLSSKPLSWLQ